MALRLQTAGLQPSQIASEAFISVCENTPTIRGTQNLGTDLGIYFRQPCASKSIEAEAVK
jgi:hypothetical protein